MAGLWRPDRSFRFHPVRGYELAPGVGEINSLGLRGPEVSPKKPDGVRRVVVIGDSYTFGLGVDVTESLPARLEARLNQDGTQHVEVLNLGTPGYNSDQEFMYLREKGMAFQPDAVVMAFNMSDAEVGFIGLKNTGNLSLIRAKEFLKAHFGLYGWTKDAIWKLLVHETRDNADVGVWPAMVPLHDAATGHPGEGWRRCQAALTGVGEECRKAHVPCILVLWPMMEQLASYRYLPEHHLVVAQAEEAGFQVIDLLSTFVDEDETKLRLSEADSHPNAVAYARAADVLAPVIEAEPGLGIGHAVAAAPPTVAVP
jgi:lysophospholipase L1-like esterase